MRSKINHHQHIWAIHSELSWHKENQVLIATSKELGMDGCTPKFCLLLTSH